MVAGHEPANNEYVQELGQAIAQTVAQHVEAQQSPPTFMYLVVAHSNLLVLARELQMSKHFYLLL